MATEQADIPGRTIKCPEGYFAFVPVPLPPRIVWSPTLVRALSEADLLLGKLAGEGRRLPNPHLLIRPFIKREAVLSSRIEGIRATLGELLASDAGAATDRSPDDLREVANYVAALDHGIKALRKLPLSNRLVKEIHAKLLKGVRGNISTPGEFRRSQNWIGVPGCTLQNASYVPPPVHEMTACLGEWEKFLHDRSLPPLVQIALAHVQFEAIHPFLDGNGRVGRLLITLFLIERDILPTPLLYLSAFFEATRRDYYDRLGGVTARGDWNAWLEYFMNGVARQAEDALGRVERINAVLKKWESLVSGPTPRKILTQIAENPFCTVGAMSRKLEVAFTTAQRAIDQLESKGILSRTSSAKRDRVYCARAIMQILDEPAKLKA